MRLKVLSCENFEENYKITWEYIAGEGFYPDGKGGQIGDLGSIGDATIIKVAEDSIIVDKFLKSDCEYSYTIDQNRRDDARENHTGEHIFSALAFLKYGWKTTSFRMTPEYCSLDFDVSDVTQEMVSSLEKEVNLKIKEGHNVQEEICDLSRAVSLLGERKSIPDKVKEDIRVLSTFPEDFNACGGLHTENTKDVRIFKILSFERVKSTFTRFYFVSGGKAIEDYNLKHNITSTLGVNLSCQPKDILSMFDKLIESKRTIEKEKKELEQKYSYLIFKEISSTPLFSFTSELGISTDFFYITETKEINENTKKLFQASNLNYLLLTFSEDNYSLVSNSVDCQKLFTEIKNKFQVKGGGNSKNINFKFSGSDSFVFFLKSVLL